MPLKYLENNPKGCKHIYFSLNSLMRLAANINGRCITKIGKVLHNKEKDNLNIFNHIWKHLGIAWSCSVRQRMLHTSSHFFACPCAVHGLVHDHQFLYDLSSSVALKLVLVRDMEKDGGKACIRSPPSCMGDLFLGFIYLAPRVALLADDFNGPMAPRALQKFKSLICSVCFEKS